MCCVQCVKCVKCVKCVALSVASILYTLLIGCELYDVEAQADAFSHADSGHYHRKLTSHWGKHLIGGFLFVESMQA